MMKTEDAKTTADIFKQDENFRSHFVPGINTLSKVCHAIAVNSGWWDDPDTGERIDRNKGELIALMHSELSECLEGIRKDCMDDKLPDHKMEHVELADAMIRIFDYAGAHDINLGLLIIQKQMYNLERADHKLKNRKKEGGKKF